MSPPLGEINGPPIPDSDAPLSKWHVEHAFGTAQECENFREKHQKEMSGSLEWMESRNYESGPERLVWLDTMCQLEVECIATDDPGLKGH